MKTAEYYLFPNIERLEVAWNLYAGRLFSPSTFGDPNYRPLAFWPYKLLDLATKNDLKSFNRLEKELFIERIRSEAFPQKVSRFHGVYLWENQEDALRAPKKWAEKEGKYFDSELLMSVGFTTFSHSKYDTQWIDAYLIEKDDCLDEVREKEWIIKYLSGVPMNENPHWEIIAEGRGIVWGTKTGNLAREFIHTNHPQLKCSLELSRLANEIDSTFGLMAPHLKIQGNQLIGSYFIDWKDMQSEVFQTKLGKHIQSLPKEHVDFDSLNGGEIVIPDMRHSSFVYDIDNFRPSLRMHLNSLLTIKSNIEWFRE